jgi:transcriptional regulator with XRE-family HTH domain
MTQASLAAAIGVAPSTYGNVESSNYVIIREDRALALARYFGLDDIATSEFIAAWKELPVSDYAKSLRKSWAKKSELRGKVKAHDRMALCLTEIISLLFSVTGDPGTLCICEFDAGAFDTGPGTGKHPSDPTRPCELCYALQALGLEGWTFTEDVTAKLMALQEKLERKSAAST